MTDYKGPNAFSRGGFKPAKPPKSVGVYARSPDGVVRQNNGPAFNNKFPKSRYPRGGGQSGLVPVLEVAQGSLPPPPEGFFYVIQDSQYVIDDNGAYVINGV